MLSRLVLRSTSKLFTIPTPHHVPWCLLSLHAPLVYQSNATISRGHARTKYTTSRRALHPKAKSMNIREDRLNAADTSLSSRAFAELRRIGMNRSEAKNLFGAIRSRLIEARGVRFVFDCLRNRETYLHNRTKIPISYIKLWDTCLIQDEATECHIGAIGPHSDETIGKACHIMGLDVLRNAEIDQDINYMSWGCFLLELAVLYGRSDAATHLLNYYNDPVRANLLNQASLQTSTREAEILIRGLATQRPHETPPGAMLAYLREEYSPRKIRLQNPKQLQWGFKTSQYVTVPKLSILEDTIPFNVYTHPAQIRLQILDHCLSKKISLPELSLEQIPRKRDETLVELAGVNDPRASMILAVQEDGPEMFSELWQSLMLAAAAGGIPEACRLLSIHYMRKEGILPVGPDTKAKLEKSLGLEFAHICIMASLESERNFVAYTLAFAALCRTAGDYDRGLGFLEESLAIVEEAPEFPRRHVAQLREHIRDYKTKDTTWPGYWKEKTMNDLLTALDPDLFMRLVRGIYH